MLHRVLSRVRGRRPRTAARATARRRRALAVGPRRLRPLAAALCAAVPLAAASPALAAPPATPDLGAWVPNGFVNAIARHGDMTYLGGSFTTVGPFTGAAAMYSLADGSLGAFPSVGGGSVYAAVPDGHGGVYIGGSFTRVGEHDAAGLAHITADGALDPAFNAVVGDGEVRSLALAPNGQRLFVGGSFTSIGQLPRDHLAAVNPTTGAPVANWSPCTGGSGEGAGSDAAAGTVYALAVSSDSATVYVGGDFDSAGGSGCSVPAVRYNLAALTASAGNVTSWDPRVDGPVYAMALQGAALYIGGTFGQLDFAGSPSIRKRIGAVSTTTGVATTWNPGASSEVDALLVHDGIVYAGGSFTRIGANNATRNGVAAIDSGGNATSFNAGLGLVSGGVDVDALAFDDPASPRRVIVGGAFASPTGGRDLLAADAVSGAPDPAFDATPDQAVLALATAAPGRVVAGGAFSSGATVPRDGIAALNRDGHATALRFPAEASGTRLAVLSPDGGTIYAETTAGLHAFSTADGHELPWAPAVNGVVNDLAVSPDGGTLYLGGAFTQVAGQPRVHLAAVTTSGAGAATAWRPDPDGVVERIALSADGATLYAGGAFGHIGTSVLDRSHLAAVSTASGDATAWAPNPNGTVTALHLSADGQHLYVGGLFASIGASPQPRPGIASLTTSTANPTPFAAGTIAPSQPLGAFASTSDDGTVYLGAMAYAFATVGRGMFEALDGGAGAQLAFNAHETGCATNSFPALVADDDDLWLGAGCLFGPDLRPHYAQFTTPVTSPPNGGESGGEQPPGGGGEPAGPALGAGGGPAPGGSGAHRAPVARLSIRTAAARLNARRAFNVVVDGPAAAKGKLRIAYSVKSGRGKRARTRAVTLATAAFRLPRAGHVAVRVRVSAAGARVVARARALKTTVTVTVGKTSARRVLTVRAAAKKPARRARRAARR
jgi:hypothetical protein